MRIVLIGAVDSSRVALEVLGRVEDRVPAVLTLPRSRAHRHSDFVDLRPPAESLGIPVHEISNVNDAKTLNILRSCAPDYAFVIGWSQICGSEFLRIPRGGCVGYHPSLLPENRGRAVIPWTILQGRRETGSTLFWMDEGMDSGDILAQRGFSIAEDETAGSLYRKHLEALDRMLEGVLPALERGDAPRRPQDHSRASYCAKRTPEDGWIEIGRAHV